MNIDTILDIWANTWQFLWGFLQIFPKASFHSFEPLPKVYNTLKKDFWSFKNIQLYNIWLWWIEEEIIINECEYDPSSSFLEMSDIHKQAFPHTSKSHEVSVQVKRLDTIKIIWNNMLIKIDTQWYEMEIIKGWIETIKRAKVCIIETSFYELYKDQPLFADVYSKMIDLWFIFHGCMEVWYNANWEVLFQDSIFINKKYAKWKE